MRRAALCVATLAMIGCSSSSKECSDSNDFFDGGDAASPERTFLPGFHLGGFALATNGRGYLSGVVGFGSCEGQYEGALFSIDAVTREANRIEVEFWPGDIDVWPDGSRAFVRPYSHKHFEEEYPPGSLAPPWDGLVVVEGNQLAIVEPTLDWFRPAPGGWVASSASYTSYFLDYSLSFDPLPATPSRCGAHGTGRYLLCENAAIRVVAQDQTPLGVLPLDSLPLDIVANAAVGLVLYSTSAGVVRNDTIELEIGLGEDLPGYRAWLAPDGNEAVVGALGPGVFRLDLQAGTSEFVAGDAHVRDVVYVGTSAVLSMGSGAELEMSPLGLVRGNSSVLPIPEHFRRGDSLEVLAVWDEVDQDWESWPLAFD